MRASQLNPSETFVNISMYQASVPRFANILRNLSGILDKAQAHADAKKIDPLALTNFRLYPDMLPMKRQVQIACDTAKGAVARLAGVEADTPHGGRLWELPAVPMPAA